MSNSPLPNFIIDSKINMIGIQNNDSKLEIHTYFNNNQESTNSISNFKRLYWAQWFGQNDAKVFDSKQNVFISEKQKLIISTNSKQLCENADIYLNLTNDTKCQGNKLTITKKLLNDKGTMLIFCDHTQCKIKTNNNKRFSL